MNKSFIVAGIGTEIGKTLISAIFTQALLETDSIRKSGGSGCFIYKKNDPIAECKGLGF